MPDLAWLGWGGGIVPALARTIAGGQDFGLLPVLADALEEAGCGLAEVLDHCRGPGLTHGTAGSSACSSGRPEDAVGHGSAVPSNVRAACRGRGRPSSPALQLVQPGMVLRAFSLCRCQGGVTMTVIRRGCPRLRSSWIEP